MKNKFDYFSEWAETPASEPLDRYTRWKAYIEARDNQTYTSLEAGYADLDLCLKKKVFDTLDPLEQATIREHFRRESQVSKPKRIDKGSLTQYHNVLQ